MLRLFFFVMTYVTDYRAISDGMRASAAFGLMNAAAFFGVGMWIWIRRWLAHSKLRPSTQRYVG
jgi:hypothetical protein